MLIKAGVDISRLNREIRRSLLAVNEFVERYEGELTITSTYDGNHGAGSLHYSNDAYDFRRPLTVHRGSVNLIKEAIGNDYDVLWRATHIHVEYDPKGE